MIDKQTDRKTKHQRAPHEHSISRSIIAKPDAAWATQRYP